MKKFCLGFSFCRGTARALSWEMAIKNSTRKAAGLHIQHQRGKIVNSASNNHYRQQSIEVSPGAPDRAMPAASDCTTVFWVADI